MKNMLLGGSPLATSRIVYGCWRIAGTQDSGAVTADARRAGIRAVQAAYEAGYTGFDLADVYCGGVCEEIFGAALRETPGMRERILLATKCGIRVPDSPPGAPYRYDFSGDYIIGCVEVALKRLGVETLDLLMLHRPDFLMEPEVVAAAFESLRLAGKVREFGVSNFQPCKLGLLQEACGFPLAVNQVEISLRRTAALEDGTLDQCLAKGVTPMAWSPLGGSGIDSFKPGVRPVLEELALVHGVSPEAVAIAWLLRHPAGIVPVIGTTRPERIRDLAKADGVELTRDDWYRLLEAALGARLP
jgi:predicted oxidoreductase